MKNYEKRILDHLVDKYERSKSFLGENKTNQSFSEKMKKLFPRYDDPAEYELFSSVNEALRELESRSFISVPACKNVFERSAVLNTDKLDEIYAYLKRVPKAELNDRLTALLESYKGENDVLERYCSEQLNRIRQNKSVERFDGDISELENILKAVREIFNVTDETYQRDFSVRLYNDSKVFEKIRGKVSKILFQYGEFPEEETVLEDLNIVKNPGHVYLKGNGSLTVKGQHIDLSALGGDIALSSVLLKDIDEIRIMCGRLITIENLTTFNHFSDPQALAVYLGGYHNTHRRNFIKKIYESNPDAEYLHYGDIDAGGFYILLHLREKTGIHFKPFRMDIPTLKQFAAYTKPLTDNDRKRLKNLLGTEFKETVQYMLENNCKLEQEAMDE